MQIKYLEVKNFKSFKDIKIYFNKLNMIVGANASRKTNLIELLKFLHDVHLNIDRQLEYPLE